MPWWIRFLLCLSAGIAVADPGDLQEEVFPSAFFLQAMGMEGQSVDPFSGEAEDLPEDVDLEAKFREFFQTFDEPLPEDAKISLEGNWPHHWWDPSWIRLVAPGKCLDRARKLLPLDVSNTTIFVRLEVYVVAEEEADRFLDAQLSPEGNANSALAELLEAPNTELRYLSGLSTRSGFRVAVIGEQFPTPKPGEPFQDKGLREVLRFEVDPVINPGGGSVDLNFLIRFRDQHDRRDRKELSAVTMRDGEALVPGILGAADPGRVYVLVIGVDLVKWDYAQSIHVIEYRHRTKPGAHPTRKVPFKFDHRRDSGTMEDPDSKKPSLYRSSFRVAPDFYSVHAQREDAVLDPFDEDPFAEKSQDEGRWDPKAVFEKRGITWPEGSAIKYNPTDHIITVVNTATNLDLIEALLAGLGPHSLTILHAQLEAYEVPLSKARDMMRSHQGKVYHEALLEELRNQGFKRVLLNSQTTRSGNKSENLSRRSVPAAEAPEDAPAPDIVVDGWEWEFDPVLGPDGITIDATSELSEAFPLRPGVTSTHSLQAASSLNPGRVKLLGCYQIPAADQDREAQCRMVMLTMQKRDVFVIEGATGPRVPVREQAE